VRVQSVRKRQKNTVLPPFVSGCVPHLGASEAAGFFGCRKSIVTHLGELKNRRNHGFLWGIYPGSSTARPWKMMGMEDDPFLLGRLGSMLNMGVFLQRLWSQRKTASRTNDYVGETLTRWWDRTSRGDAMAVFLKKKTFVCTHDHPKSSIVKSPLNLTVVSFGQSKCISSKNCGPKWWEIPESHQNSLKLLWLLKHFRGGYNHSNHSYLWMDCIRGIAHAIWFPLFANLILEN